MKKLFTVCVVVLGLMVSPCFAIHYCKDFLEPGNPGGWQTSLKTFDDEWSLNIGEVVELDIWINDVPEKLINAGFWITYDPSLVSIDDVLAYDNSDLPGPWSQNPSAIKIQDPLGPGTYFITMASFSGAPQDADGDILLGKIRFLCESEGNSTITVSTTPDDTFELVVGWLSAHTYDDEISPNSITLYQTSCAVDEECDDNNLCTADSCNPSTGVCSFNPVIECDDNNLCTADSCNPSTGECLFNLVDCDDGDACTSDSCDSVTGECTYNPLDCNFGYFTDFLEPGNPGGWTSSHKTFDSEWTLSPGEEIEMDIWLHDVSETMSFAGFWIEYDPSLVSILGVKAYDGDLDGTEGDPSPCCPGLSGLWDPGFTLQGPNLNDPGTYFLSLGQSNCIAHDAGGDIILGRVRVRCESLGDATITVKFPPNFSTVIGCSGSNYESQLAPNMITIHQNLQSEEIPTLSEWGMIIFMTVILGIGVVTILKRRMV